LDRHGYLNRVRSSRRLEMESHRNIEVIWLLRGVKPDFKTIADFRRDNRAAFRSPMFMPSRCWWRRHFPLRRQSISTFFR
jgi:hypothetical protein